MKMSICHKLFEFSVKKFPDSIAIEEANKEISYSNLNKSANRLAHLLMDLGVGNERIVGTLISPGIHTVVALLGIFKAGGIYLPLTLKFSKERLRQVFEETFHEILITSSSLKSQVCEVLQKLKFSVKFLITITDDDALIVEKWVNGAWIKIPNKALGDDNPKAKVTGETSNYIFYSSGSTGAGKPILGCHRSLAHFIQWEINEFQIKKSYRVSQLVQVTFDASLRDIFIPLCTGGALIIPTEEVKSNTTQLINWIQKSEISLIHTIPSIFRLITRDIPDGWTFPKLRLILLAGEPLYGRDILEWRDKVGTGIELVNLYGLTETTLLKTFHRINLQAHLEPSKTIHVGKPISETDILIIDQHKLCTAGKQGEILIKSKYLSKGYYRRNDLNEKVFIQNPLGNDPLDIVFKTGDMGFYLEDGNVFVSGRIDDQIKINGIRVEPGEVQEAILKMRGVTGAVVTGKVNIERSVELTAYYTSENVSPQSLREHLVKNLNRDIIPSYLIKLDSFPLNHNGKIDKSSLPDPGIVTPAGISLQSHLMNPTETEIQKVWKGILNLQHEAALNSSFFDLGGNSLKAIQLISRLCKKFNVLISIADIYQYSTIEQQARYISTKVSISEYECIRPAERADSYPLSHAQKRIWFIDQIHSNTAIANMPEAFILDSDLNLDLLNDALNFLICRHESLRTSFIMVNGEPRQKIWNKEAVSFQIDFCNLSNALDSYEAAVARAHYASIVPFDLQNGLLIRLHVFQFDTTKFILLFNTHHIIADAWSIEILFKELVLVYDALVKKNDVELVPLGIQYKDYAVWHNRQLTSGAFDTHKNFWATLLNGCRKGVCFPPDTIKNEVCNEGMLSFFIEEHIRFKLVKIAQEEEVSVFMILYTLLNVLMNKYTGADDIVIGTPVTGRDRLELENQIGYYVNVIPLRAIIYPQDTFHSLLQRIKFMVLKAYQYQVYAVDEIINDLNTLSENRVPIFSVMIQLQNKVFSIPSNSSLRIRPVNIDYKGNVDFKMSFRFTEEDDKIISRVGFDSNYYSQESVQRIADNYCYLIRQIISDLDLKLSAIDLFTFNEEIQEQSNFLASMRKV